MIEVTPLVEDDRPDWEELFRGYHLFYGRTWTPEQFEQSWLRFQRDGRIHALGARLDGRLVGITHFLTHASTSTPDVCYLQDLFTDPAQRGKGVGRALIKAVESWARGQNCARVYWHTRSDNHPARRLYDQVAEHQGFIVYTATL